MVQVNGLVVGSFSSDIAPKAKSTHTGAPTVCRYKEKRTPKLRIEPPLARPNDEESLVFQGSTGIQSLFAAIRYRF